MSMQQIRGAVEWALMVALVFGAGAIAQAQDKEAQPDAKVIQIGPADAHHDVPHLQAPGAGQQQPELPKYWIGLLGYDQVPAPVRHHVQIPENQGVMVREVMPNSPAAKAGIEQYDILLRANDAELHEMADLKDLVRTQGEQKGQVTLEVLRHGERNTVYVTPEQTPANVAQRGGFGRGFGGGFGGGMGGFEGMPGELQQFFGQGGPEGGPGFDFRHFGPGVIVGGQGIGVAQLPNGDVSINIQKDNDQPAHITVKRGNETWEVVGDDPESLKQLPDDLRPFVERMLHGGGPANFNIEMPEFGQMPGRPAFDGQRLRERLDAMERQLQEMQQRLLGPNRPAEAQPAQPNEQAQ